MQDVSLDFFSHLEFFWRSPDAADNFLLNVFASFAVSTVVHVLIFLTDYAVLAVIHSI